MTTTAWYIIPSQRLWARWFNILHWPYLAWHLSYVVIGAALAPNMSWPLLGWTVLAFFLGMGICAHCCDLIKGDPLRLGIHRNSLYVVGGIALGGAGLIGWWQFLLGNISPWLLVAIPIGFILAWGYGVEWPGLHGDWQFATWWAVFPFLVGYFAQGIAWHPALLPLAVFIFLSAMTQRVLSTRVRYLRRKVGKATVSLETYYEDQDAWFFGIYELKPWLLEPDEKALAWMSAAMVMFGLAAVATHL